MWRGSLLPLGREVPLKPVNPVHQTDRDCGFTTAAQPSGSKLPRHRDLHHPFITARPLSAPPVEILSSTPI
ncbi:hypothetical protein CKQ80_11735 [Pseudomonas moraviensis]|uniref:Uncharacterized protein n=1 Tax=Pseudomonas moraviensis TaxID=321662 RepID=A0A2A2PK50_9PSED|nr:hypothetical protein CKQ80_11735 [Pseudomonas moraviensis]PAW59437.1 hypothetical protein CKQ68_01480 [Pseudomonas moraviensis]